MEEGLSHQTLQGTLAGHGNRLCAEVDRTAVAPLQAGAGGDAAVVCNDMLDNTTSKGMQPESVLLTGMHVCIF